ncbi:hypothetical protein [Peribacillus kribbensis]|uniref:hypothetical protein n=1 Tax=Peribacillus kribbensis TaxID=356658 RepID=UPI00047EF62B|nr:hypothetical protein [Peribacillus kribbensis]
MGRYKQRSDGKGSLKLIQTLINEHVHVINKKLSLVTDENIIWVSPLEKDEYAEYSDVDFIERVALDGKVASKLKEFWPTNGPRWDALAKYGENGVFIIEAKANLKELISPHPLQ